MGSEFIALSPRPNATQTHINCVWLAFVFSLLFGSCLTVCTVQAEECFRYYAAAAAAPAVSALWDPGYMKITTITKGDADSARSRDKGEQHLGNW